MDSNTFSFTNAFFIEDPDFDMDAHSDAYVFCDIFSNIHIYKYQNADTYFYIHRYNIIKYTNGNTDIHKNIYSYTHTNIYKLIFTFGYKDSNINSYKYNNTKS